mmetsp:Transcript_3790/g.11105  ORF Transcript_3790/g.11105 Transcript_3790/m.11105 type:complete len:277 (+) Transcript_3790:239-1069(+)
MHLLRFVHPPCRSIAQHARPAASGGGGGAQAGRGAALRRRLCRGRRARAGRRTKALREGETASEARQRPPRERAPHGRGLHLLHVGLGERLIIHGGHCEVQLVNRIGGAHAPLLGGPKDRTRALRRVVVRCEVAGVATVEVAGVAAVAWAGGVGGHAHRRLDWSQLLRDLVGHCLPLAGELGAERDAIARGGLCPQRYIRLQAHPARPVAVEHLVAGPLPLEHHLGVRLLVPALTKWIRRSRGPPPQLVPQTREQHRQRAMRGRSLPSPPPPPQRV